MNKTRFCRVVKLGLAAAFIAGLASEASAADIAVVGGRVDDPFFAIVKAWRR